MRNDKKYLLDGYPVTASQLIDAASDVDDHFASDWMKSTSVAARILRDNGQSVETTRLGLSADTDTGR